MLDDTRLEWHLGAILSMWQTPAQAASLAKHGARANLDARCTLGEFVAGLCALPPSEHLLSLLGIPLHLLWRVIPFPHDHQKLACSTLSNRLKHLNASGWMLRQAALNAIRPTTEPLQHRNHFKQPKVQTVLAQGTSCSNLWRPSVVRIWATRTHAPGKAN